MALCLPRPGLCFLAWLSLAPLLWQWSRDSSRSAFWSGFLAGLAFHGLALHWIYLTCRFAAVSKPVALLAWGALAASARPRPMAPIVPRAALGREAWSARRQEMGRQRSPDRPQRGTSGRELQAVVLAPEATGTPYLAAMAAMGFPYTSLVPLTASAGWVEAAIWEVLDWSMAASLVEVVAV